MSKLYSSLSLVLVLSTLFARASVEADTAILVDDVRLALSVCLPDDYDAGNSYPLIIGLHYCGGNSVEYRNALQPLCDSLGVIIACPGNFGNEITNPDIITVSIDTVLKIWSADPDQVYLTGMSCNGLETLLMGLDPVYPFRGIFPWDPWVLSFDSETFNLDSDMPVVVAIGGSDPNFKPVVRVYDSLLAHGANVSLQLAPGVGHTLDFPEFADDMTTCMYYLNDTGSISLSIPPDMSMTDQDGPAEVMLTVTNQYGLNLGYTAVSSHDQMVEVSDVEIIDETTIRITVDPLEKRSGRIYIVVQARDLEGTAMTQSVFRIELERVVLGLDENKGAQPPLLYPQPAGDHFTIEFSAPDYSWQLYNVQGSMVKEGRGAAPVTQIDCSGLIPGQYVLKIVSGEKLFTQKILIHR